MKCAVNKFLIVAIMVIAMFTACKDDKDESDPSSLLIDQVEIEVLAAGGTTLISVSTDLSWNASSDAEWVKLSPASGTGAGAVTVTVDQRVGERRTATITFTAGAIVKTVDVQQRGYVQSDFYKTGEVIHLHRHTVGNGIAIVIIGDGFDMEDCRKGGFYESECRHLSDLILSMPIFRDFTSYFDIMARVDVSRERGVRNCVADPATCPENAYDSGHPQIDFNKAQENASRAAGDERDYWVIFMGNGQIGGYALGNMAIYSCPENLKPYWMMHEFGHAFGDFPDRYYIAEQGKMTPASRTEIDANHANGDLLMFDWRKDPAEVYWKDFIGRNGYEKVGVFPAGYFGLELGELSGDEPFHTSVMYGPTPYYTVMERYQLWRKIQLRAGFTTTTISEFIAYDANNLIDDWSTWDRYPNWVDNRYWND